MVPAQLRTRWKIWQRAAADKRENFIFATTYHRDTANSASLFCLSQTQVIRYSSTLENKLHNLHLGAARIHLVTLHPNEIFSFWKLVGNPSLKTGFAKSRSIVNGKLEAETGGGLCQLSGIIYLLALNAGLKIIERHPHSLDIYTDAERFTPLGADATVAYGYKDLRIQNNLRQSFYFSIKVEPQQLTAALYSQQPFVERSICFDYAPNGQVTQVKTLSDGKLLFTDWYKKMPANI